jgi:DNA-binding CsgD family transcriptional regulator
MSVRAADPVGTELRRRVADVIAEARRALGLADEQTGVSAADVVAGLIAEVESRLEAQGGDRDRQATGRAHAAQLARVRRRHEARAAALASVREAVARLREVTAPGTILDRAPRELCLCSQLDRVVLSLVRGGHMIATTAWFRDDAAGAAAAVEALAGDPPRLEYPLIETDLLRRRRASIVADVQVHPRSSRRMAEVMGWDSFVAAPVVVRGDVIGIIHADAGTSGRALDVLDGDVLWTFTTGLADAYETASLRRSLRRQQSELREFVDWLAARSSELSNASASLALDQAPPPEPPGRLDVTSSALSVDDRVVFEELLTRRELDVLRLLARGETNSGIAAQLVISERTVKFHIGNILGKLRAGNRAEAVSRYHRLIQLGPRQEERTEPT